MYMHIEYIYCIYLYIPHHYFAVPSAMPFAKPFAICARCDGDGASDARGTPPCLRLALRKALRTPSRKSINILTVIQVHMNIYIYTYIHK